MTRILIASLNYAPEETGIAPYSTKLAEHLAAQGYSVSVVTGMPHYPAWRVDAAYAARRSCTERINGVDVHRRAHYVPPTQSAPRRARYEATSLMMSVDALRGDRPDAIIGVVPSLSGGVVARLAAKRFGVPYSLVFQDLVGQSATQSGIRGGRVAAGAIRAAEGWVSRGAEAVAVITEGFRPYLESLGVDPTRVRRIRNWTHVEPVTIDRAAMRARLDWPREAIVCLHAGNMGQKQGLENIIHTARLGAQASAPFLFVLMGDGNQRQALQALAAKLALPNLRFLSLQPAAELSSVIAAADVLLINQRGSVTDMSLPSKLTSYYAAARPVVAAAASSSETAREIVASNGGIVVPPDDPHAMLDGIIRIASDPGLAAYLAQNARTWATATLAESTALRAYEQLVAATLTAGKHGRVHTPYRAPAPISSSRASTVTDAGSNDRRAA